jgi:hypothetical protein
MPGVRVLVIFPSLCRVGVSKSRSEIVSSPVFSTISEGGGDVKPNMNYESEFIKGGTRPATGPKPAQ